MEVLLIDLAARVVFGSICAALASGKGRSAVGWFFIGALLGCIGLIIVLVVSDLNAEHAMRSRLTRENRRLKERLRVHEQVSETRHRETQRRLEVHDRALGVDTNPQLAGGQTAPAVPPPRGAPEGVFRACTWYYDNEDESAHGPMEFEELEQAARQGRVALETYVWTEGMDGSVSCSTACGSGSVEASFGSYRIAVRRGASYPETSADLERLQSKAETLIERAALGAITGTGVIFVRLEDEEARVLDARPLSIRRLLSEPAAEAEVFLSGRIDARIVRLALDDGR